MAFWQLRHWQGIYKYHLKRALFKPLHSKNGYCKSVIIFIFSSEDKRLEKPNRVFEHIRCFIFTHLLANTISVHGLLLELKVWSVMSSCSHMSLSWPPCIMALRAQQFKWYLCSRHPAHLVQHKNQTSWCSHPEVWVIYKEWVIIKDWSIIRFKEIE